MITEQTESGLSAKLDKWIGNFLESQLTFWDSYVDPREALLGPDGELWKAIGATGAVALNEEPPYRTEAELQAMRCIGKYLWQENEFAQNGHENRVSYIVGWGHTYTVAGIHKDVPKQVLEKATKIVDRWRKVNRWMHRQQENTIRGDRDGNVFIWRTKCDDGIVHLRYIEPVQIGSPGIRSEFDDSFGIRTKKDDIETVLAYNVKFGTAKENWVDAGEIQHRKYNVDSGLKCGIPLFWSVRKNLVRAQKLLRNMSVATEIQTAIALIRKHENATKEAVRTLLSAKAVGTTQDLAGNSRNVFQYGPGSIIDAPKGTSYGFPKDHLDPSKTVAALQAELRAVAARLQMPEFMLTSDASNANFSSTMVAEGPAVKRFERDQQSAIHYDLALINEQLDYSVKCGELTDEERALIEVNANAPSCNARDSLKEAQVRQIDIGLRILSPQTATGQIGEDYDTEQTNIETHEEAHGAIPTGTAPPNDDLI